MPITILRLLARNVPQVVAGLVFTLLVPVLAWGQTGPPTTFTVFTEAQLRTALTSAVGGDSIVFGASITLTADLPNVGTSITIDGGGCSLSGANQFRGLFVAAFAISTGPPVPQPLTVSISNLTITNTVATGGAGGAGASGGGGGAGMGGALFIGERANVTVSNVSLNSNAAVGGAGGAGSGIGNSGGGGGLGGNGGTGPGGGGGIGVGANGGAAGASGLPGIITGVFGGGGGGAGGIAGSNAGSAGGMTFSGQASIGGGGGGDAGSIAGFAPFGGFGGGGGGTGSGGSPGFGFGGFGGGGGGSTVSGATNAGGTFGGSGGTGTTAGGGGGAGLGGAIFIESNVLGTTSGTLTINGGFSINGAAVTAGAGATGGGNGTAAGSGIFIQGNTQFGVPGLTFAPGAGQTATVAGAIVDELGLAQTVGGASVAMSGAGTLVLSGNNLYSGGTTVSSGILSVASDTNLGLTNPLTGPAPSVFVTGGTLQITGSNVFARDMLLGTGAQTVSVTPGQSATWSGLISASDSPSGLNVTGGGTLSLANAANSYSLGTSISGNSKVVVGQDGALGATGAGIGGITLGDASTTGTLSIDATSFSNLFTSARAFTLLGAGTIESVGATSATLSGSMDGTGSLSKTGTGTLILGGTNSYSGATSVNAGILQAGSSTAFGLSTSLSVGAGATADFNGFSQSFFSVGGTGTVALNSLATLTVGTDNSSSSFAGVFTGTGRLIKAGTGALTLSGANTFGGGLALTAGTLNVAVDANLGGAGAVSMSNGTTLGLTSSGTFAHALQVAGTSTVNVGTGLSTTWSGLVSDNASAGTLQVTGGGLFALTNASNSYSGGTIVTGGSTVSVDADGALGAVAGGLTLGDTTSTGTLAITTAGAFTSSRGITLGAAGGTIDTASTTDATLGGVVGGTGGLTKAGTGALTLSGANTFSGGLALTAGTLNVGADANLGGAGAVTLGDATTLGITASGVFAHNLLLEGSSLVSVGAGNSVTWDGLIGAAAVGPPGPLSDGRPTQPDVILGAGALRVSGGGALTLTNTANSYVGGTGVSGGSTLFVSADGALGAAGTGITLGDTTSTGTLGITTAGAFTSARDITLGTIGGTIDTASATAATLGGVIGGTGGLFKTGTGTLTLSGINTFAGGLTLTGGTVNVAVDANLGGAGAVTLGDTTTLGITGSGVFTHNLVLEGTSSVTVGAGNSVTWSGLVGAGTDGFIAGGAAQSDVVLSAGALRLSGGGALTLTNTANSYVGGTGVTGGSTLFVGADSVLGAAGTGITLGDTTSTGTLGITTAGAFTSSRDLTVGTIGGTIDTANATFATLSGVMSGTGSLTKTGGGALTLSGSNTFGGGLALTAGTLNVAADANLGGAGAVTMGNGTTLGLTSSGIFAHALQVAGTSTVNVGTGLSTTWSGLVSNNVSANNVSAGTLQVTGGGLFALTNASNSYTGGTIVTGGSTLSVPTDGALGAAGAGLTLGNASSTATLGITAAGVFTSSRGITLGALGATIDTASTTAATLAGVIGGAGGLTKTGGGSLTLSGTNTYAGATIVQGGTLFTGRANLFGSSAVLSVASGATVNLNGLNQTAASLGGTGRLTLGQGATFTLGGNNASMTFSGTIGGTGGLVKNGTGQLTLLGTNTFTGGIAVNGGVLLGTSNSLLGNIVNNAQVGFNQTTDGTYGGAMSGTGSLFKNGAGRLTLSGTNTFTGGITVNAGGLWGTSASLVGNIVNNAQVGFDQSISGTYSGVMSGTGGLVKAGTGALTLTGANTYTGGTFISGGSLIGSTTSLQGTFTDNSELVFNQAFNGAFRGFIGGSGNLTKLGTGTVSLSGPQGYTGLTWIREGTLAIDSGLLGNVIVDFGGTLWGTGTIGGSLNLGGTLLVPAPGSQFATFDRALAADQTLTAGSQTPTMFINGNLTTTAGSTINVTVSPVGAPPLVVSGSANLVDTHLIMNINDPNPARFSTYVALSAAGGLHITGGDITSPNTTLLPVLKSDPNALMVTILNLSVPLGGVGSTPNAAGAGRAIDATKLGATGDYGFVVRELTALTDPNLNTALRELSGEIHATGARMIALDSLSVTDLVRNELSSVEHDGEDNPRASKGGWAPRPWFQLSGDHTNFTSGNFSGGTANVGGGGGGVDFRPSSSWTAGAGLALSLGDLNLSDVSETSKMTSPRAFTYFGFGFGPFHIHWGGSLARSTTTTKRNIQFAALVPDASGQPVPLSVGVDRVASSDQVSTSRDAWSDWQFTRKFGTWTFDGKLGLRFASYTRQAFSETGADSISLDVSSQTLSTREFNIDLHQFRHSGTWLPNIWVTYRRDFGDDWTRATVNFLDNPNSAFAVQGVPVPRDTVQGLFGITMRTRAGLMYTFEYQILRNTDETRQSVRFKVRI